MESPWRLKCRLLLVSASASDETLSMKTLVLLLTVALLPVQGKPWTLFDQPIDELYKLRVVVRFEDGGTLTRVLLVDRTNADRFWELARLIDMSELNFRLERVDRSSLVLSRTTEYGIQEGFIKLFFHTPSKRLLRRIDFKPHQSIDLVSEEEW